MGFFSKEIEKENENARLKVLGSGCVNCNKLEQNARQAISELGKNIDIAHVKDFAKIAEYGVMRTPALVLDEKLICSGRVLSVDEIKELIKDA